MSRLLLFNKPYGVLSQFTGQSGDSTLADYIGHKRVYPAGRLDKDSEGLLLLTDDGKLQQQITDPAHKMAKTYWVQVEGLVARSQLVELAQGVELNDGISLPAQARPLDPYDLWPRIPPIRQRQHIPTSWLELIIKEGRNRQVRRMTAAVGLPTLRLIRVQIGPWQLRGLQPGQWRMLRAPG